MKKCILNLILIYGIKNITNNYRLLRRHDEGALDVVDSPEVDTNFGNLLLISKRSQKQGNTDIHPLLNFP
jgi:hypothetical protein